MQVHGKVMAHFLTERYGAVKMHEKRSYHTGIVQMLIIKLSYNGRG